MPSSAPNLWTPDGPILLHREIEPMSERDVRVLSAMHEVAFRHKIELRCAKCGSPFQGANNDSTRTLTVACRCRELRYTTGT